ncbi:MAG: hypothetical protein ACK5X3_15510 [Pseudomonadota bacterium]|jgi:hypothetical protein
MAANEGKLSDLHEKVAHVLSEALNGQELPGEIDEETGEVRVIKIPPSAAILQVAAKFLKDNNITCAPGEDNAMGELKAKMEARAKARELRKSDVVYASEDMSFLTGLPN